MPDAGPAGFEEWVVARRPALLRTAWLLTGDPHDAEDLVQATLVKVVPRWGRLAADPEPYVRRMLVNANLSRWRHRRWREVHTDTPPETPDTTSAAATTDERLALLAALRELTPRQRAVIVLRYFDDLTERQTADVLGIGLGTVKSHARDALARLRQLLPGLDLVDTR